GPAVLLFTNSEESHDGEIMALRRQHFSLSPFATGVEVGAQHEERVTTCLRVETRLPVLAGLNVVGVEERIEARALQYVTNSLNELGSSIKFETRVTLRMADEHGDPVVPGGASVPMEALRDRLGNLSSESRRR